MMAHMQNHACRHENLPTKSRPFLTSPFEGWLGGVFRSVSILAVVEWAVVAAGITAGVVGDSAIYGKQYVDYCCCDDYENEGHL